MLRAKTKDDSHAALVFGTSAPGQPALALYKDDPAGYPNFPGGRLAMKDSHRTRYFRGDVDADGATVSRELTAPFRQDAHFNYLNSRGDDKRNAELLYFANARQMREDGFDFFEYSLLVTDNWSDFS